MSVMKYAPLALVLFLGACASEPEDRILNDSVKSALKSLGNKPDIAAQRRLVGGLSRAQLIGTNPNPLILVDFESTGQFATIGQISINGAYDIFGSADQKTMSFTGGLLSATRGIGSDLMSLEQAQTSKALQAGSKAEVATIRTHRYLGGENQMIAVSYQCQLRNKGQENITSVNARFKLLRFEESCTPTNASAPSYTNVYWLEPKRKSIWKSRQWVSPGIGYMVFDVLTPTKS